MKQPWELNPGFVFLLGSSFFNCDKKDVKTQKNIISTSKRHAKHLLVEIHNTQIQLPVFVVILTLDPIPFFYFFVDPVFLVFLWASVAAWYRMTIQPPSKPSPINQ